jgi:hypothetical protein
MFVPLTLGARFASVAVARLAAVFRVAITVVLGVAQLAATSI